MSQSERDVAAAAATSGEIGSHPAGAVPVPPSTHPPEPHRGAAGEGHFGPWAPAPGRVGRWTGARVVVLVIGSLLALISVVLLGAGATVLWVDRTQRDGAGDVTTGVHGFTSAGSALITDRIDLGAPGVGWAYSPAVLGEVVITVTPTRPGTAAFVGIAPSADVDGYLTGVSHTVIADFWSDRVEAVAGGTAGTSPVAQHFWVASSTASGTQTLRWNPTGGSWTVVVMNADASPGIDVRTSLSARIPALPWIGLGLLAAGLLLLAGGVLLIAGAPRPARTAHP